MFAPNSRYFKVPTVAVTMSDGRVVAATRCAVPQSRPLAGWHRRVTGDRLDLLAARFLKDPTLFWVLCDANNAPSPDALAARDLIGIPTGPNTK